MALLGHAPQSAPLCLRLTQSSQIFQDLLASLTYRQVKWSTEKSRDILEVAQVASQYVHPGGQALA